MGQLMTSQQEWDLFAIGRWWRGAENKIANSAFFQIPMYKQFQMMEDNPALKELWEQYCTFLYLCYNQQQNKDTK